MTESKPGDLRNSKGEAGNTSLPDAQILAWLESNVSLPSKFQIVANPYVIPMTVGEVWTNFFGNDAPFIFD